MRTLKPRVKVYIIGILTLTILFLAVCIPLYLSGYITLAQLLMLIAATFTGHLVGSIPFSPDLLSSNATPQNVQPAESGDTCTLYVGNLLYRTKRDDLVRVFSKFGEVFNARIILDKDSRKSKGYGFVEMAARDAKLAINALNGSELNGRALRVNEAKGR